MSTADEVNVLSTLSSSRQRCSLSTDCLTPFMYLPVYIFEVCKFFLLLLKNDLLLFSMILVQHLSNNYRFISQYSRVAICLDFELICAQQNQREAFSINELDESRRRLNHLLSCQQDLDDLYRSSRWLVDVINCAKDKSYAGISLKSWLTFQKASNNQLKMITNDSSSSNYASDSALNTTKYAGSTLTLPTVMTSTSLSSSFLNDTSNYDRNFIDHELNSINPYLSKNKSTRELNHSIELTYYIPELTSNELIPFKIRTNKMVTSHELLKLILKQQSTSLKCLSTLSSFVFIWIHSNGRKQIIDDDLTAENMKEFVIRYGGQLLVCSKDSSTSCSIQSC